MSDPTRMPPTETLWGMLRDILSKLDNLEVKIKELLPEKLEAEPGDGWYYLKPDDKVQRGDFCAPDESGFKGAWTSANSFLGTKCGTWHGMQFRRQAEPATLLSNDGGWYYLKPDDKIQEGDFIRELCLEQPEFEPVQSQFGKPASTWPRYQFRRKVEPATDEVAL